MPAKFSSARMVTIMVFAGCIVLPTTAQSVANLPVLAPGLHSQTLPRANEPTIHYAISIPRNYSPPARVPLILALHFGVSDGDSSGAGRDVVRFCHSVLRSWSNSSLLPDSMQGEWSSPENEDAVNALLDVALARYSVDMNKVAVTGFSMGGTGSWHFAAKYPERFSAAFQSPAAHRNLPPRGAFRFWPSIPVTTKLHQSAQRKRAFRSFRNPA